LEEGVSEAKLFVKVKAAFHPDELDVEQYDLMGLELPDEPVFVPILLSVPNIMGIYPNKLGGLNITMADGDKWSTDAETAGKITQFLESLAVDLT
jgi:hypothetical protein